MQTVNLVVRVYRPSILVGSTAFAQTVLVAPRVEGEAGPTGAATLSLVIDTSGSMAGQKLENAKAAATMFVDHLRPGDRMAIVAFDNEPRVIAPMGTTADAASMRAAIAGLHSGGGTMLGTAMRSARDLMANRLTGSAARVIVLTDGATSDDNRCQQEAREAANSGLPISCYGLGTDWNAELLTYIAETTKGRARTIDSAANLAADLGGEFRDLQDTALTGAEIIVAPSDGVGVASVHRVIPDVVNYALGAAGAPIVVGDISRDPDTAPQFLLELVLPPRPAGSVRVARVSMRYREVGSAATGETDLMNVVVNYTSDQGEAARVDPDIKRLIDLRAASVMVDKAMVAANAGDTAKATTLLTNARAVTQRLGQPQVTTKLDDAINQLAAGGKISQETKTTIVSGVRKTTDLKKLD
ncbi:MAG TPA: VWA domain-containing protein [Propionicimonas sp.]|jgi:Ca-activated chloride channel family protein